MWCQKRGSGEYRVESIEWRVKRVVRGVSCCYVRIVGFGVPHFGCKNAENEKKT